MKERAGHPSRYNRPLLQPNQGETSMHKMLVTLSLLMAAATAQAGEPVELTDAQLDKVTAGGQQIILNLDGNGREGLIVNNSSPSRAKVLNILNPAGTTTFDTISTPGTTSFEPGSDPAAHITLVNPTVVHP
jgi:hypothetical protein